MYDRIIDKLKQLEAIKENNKPLWGIMSPQHMVEHLTLTLEMSSGKFNLECKSPAEKIPTLKKILMGSRPLPKGFINPVTGEGLIPLKYKDLEEAKRKVNEEMKKFIGFFEAEPDAVIIHPLFGLLNKEEWIVFHEKHFTHHLTQFGIL